MKATTVAGRTLSGRSRDARHGAWHALLPAESGQPVLGALRVDRALLAPQGTRDRLAAAVLAVGRLRLPGVLGTVDLVAEAGEVWLITARPAAPTLADLLAGGGTGPDAGSAASVLNETAQTLLALHAAGLAHGALGADTVVLAPDGVALLAEAALGTVLGDTSGGETDAARRAADVAAWAGLARTLGEAWVAPGTPAAAVFARCCAAAGSKGLAAGRAALVAGRAALPEGFLRRTELRAAVATVATAVDGVPDPGGAEAGGAEAQSPESQSPESQSPESQSPESQGAGPGVGDVVPEGSRLGLVVPDEQLTLPGRTRSAPHRPRSAAPDDQVTLLGKRNRAPAEPLAAAPSGILAAAPSGPPTAAPAEASTPSPAGEGGDGGEILLRFGPGVPVEDQDALRAQWRTAPVPPDRRPRRRGRWTWIATTVFLTVAAVLLWLLLRPSPAPTVTAVEVRAPVGRLHCGQTADLVGVVTTDGRGGPVTYHWLRSDGHDSGELVRTARRGERRVTVHLRWTVRGPGSFRGTARLRIVHQGEQSEAEGTFSYTCS
ncbi:hypothetical protein [Streptomyces sp. NPDC001914]|uniref:hypothetical protein n=1 Tax=Streptomyces sp. NPDC001914 TaxID=3364623 RepID=UPI0036C79A30